MKIRKIKIAGFRGFNIEQEIFINDKLTIIYGPNSYGKTSISEALEWLLFGITSKVQVCPSGKNEFKGTYRNIHHPQTSTPFVELLIDFNGTEFHIRGELNKDDSITRLCNSEKVNSWPWETPDAKTYSPFVLQHALQDLLLTSPSERYSQFSRLLGTQILDDFQDVFNSLATRFNTPKMVTDLVLEIENFLLELTDNSFNIFVKSLKSNDLAKTINQLNRLASPYLKDSTIKALDENGIPISDTLEILIENQKEEVGAIFNKEVSLQAMSEQNKVRIHSMQDSIVAFVSQELIEQYLDYAKLKAQTEFKKQAHFYEVGLQIIKKTPDICPFCETQITDDIINHVLAKHNMINTEIDTFKELDLRKTKFLEDLRNFKQSVENYASILTGNISTLDKINNKDDKEKIKSIFGEEHLETFEDLMKILEDLCTTSSLLSQNKRVVLNAIQEIENSFVKYNQTTDHIDKLNDAILIFISTGKEFFEKISTYNNTTSQISEIFGKQLNILAGTQNLAKVITLLEQFGKIKKYIQIKQAINSMKNLRAEATQYVSDKSRTIFEDQLTDEVMNWYEQIKTIGDPDVHFSGFSLGGRKDRHEISISATSYGEELVSAVSSLSESKLNALGLSIKISNNVKDGIPFGFLIIDDPVQSLDNEHSVQISEIIRKLVEEYNKQIILLSHNQKWIEQLIKGCQTLNGTYYQMTGFDIEGPKIYKENWKTWRRRLDDINAICQNTSATQVQLQQAEEEIRLATNDIASLVYTKKTGKRKSTHDLGEAKIRSMLLEAGIDTRLVDRISQTFTTSDESHHLAENYEANRQRIMRYHSWLCELTKELK